MLGGEIKVVMTLDDKDFSIKTVKNNQVLSEMKRSMEQTAVSARNLETHFTSLGKKFHDTVFTMSLLRFAMADLNDVFLAFPKAVLKTSGEIERLTKLMEGLSAETDDYKRKAEAAAGVKFVFNLAQNAPFEVKALTDSFVKLKTAGLDPTDGKLQALTNSIAKFGGTSDIMHRASIAIQQMAGKGVISMEELRQQLGEAMPNAMQLMSEGLGLSVADLAKKVGQGVVDAQQGLSKMFFQMEMQNAGYAKDMMDTWNGQIEKLKTKWEMFKVEVGKTGGFEAARQELKKIIDAFDTTTAESWANKLGNLLEDLVRIFATVKDFIVKYSDEIQAAITALLVSKVASMVAPFKSGADGIIAAFATARAAARDNLIQEQEDVKRMEAIKANELRFRIEANEKQIQSLNSTKTAQHLANAREMESEIEQSRKLILERRDRYAEMMALQEQFLAQTMAKELAAEEMMRRKKAGTAALAREMQAEADRFRANAGVAGGAAATIDAEIAAIQRSIKEKERLIALEQRHSKFIDESTHAIHGQNAALAQQATAAEMAAAAQTKLSMGAGTLSGVWGGMKAVLEGLWSSLKGFTLSLVAMGVQFALVTAAVEGVIWIWNKIGEAAEKSADRMRKAYKAIEDLNKGFADNASVANIQAELGVKKARLESLLTQGGSASREITFTDKDGKDVTKKKSQWIDELRTQVDQMEEQLERAKKIAGRNNVASLVQGLRAEVDNVKDDAGSVFRQRYIELKNQEDEELKLMGDNQAKRKAVITKYNERRDQLNREQIDAEKVAIDNLTREKRRNLQLFKDGQLKMSEEEAKALEVGIVEMGKMRDSLETKYQQSRIGFTAVLGGKGEGRKRDPLAEMLLDLEGQVAAAQAKLEATVRGVRGIDQIRQETALELMGKVAKGEFDKTVKNEDGKTQVERRGGADRGQYVARLRQYLAEGNTDIGKFIDSIDTMDAAVKKSLKGIIEERTTLNSIPEAQKLITDIRGKAAAAKDALAASEERYATQGLAKEETATLSLIKALDKEEAKYLSAKENLKVYQQARAELVADTMMTAANNAYADEAEKLRKAKEEEYNLTASLEDQKKRAHENEMARINEQYNLRQRLAQDELQKAGNTEEAVKRFNDVMIRATEARTIAQERANVQMRTGSMTELDRLTNGWQNTVDQMNRLSANWANSFIDTMVTLTTGGKVEWRKMVADMATQVYKIFLQKQFAEPLADMLGSLVKGIGKGMMAGAGQQAAAAATTSAATSAATGAATTAATGATTGAAQTAAVTTAMTTMTAETTTAMTTVVTEMTTGMTGLTTAMGEMSLVTTSSMGEMVAVVSAAMAEMVTTSAAGAAFADGGIMTSSGPLSLKAYANGGVATSPQLALFGEGSMNEAYVPLPDGRSIPVTMSAPQGIANSAAATGTNVSINIVVNKDGTSNASASGDSAQDWTSMANKVKDVVRTELVTQTRPGGLLYK